MCAGNGNGNTIKKGNLQYICSQHVMYPGIVIGAAASIGTDLTADPKLYLQLWHKITPQPLIFLADGGKFVDVSFLQGVVQNCEVAVFDLKAAKDITQERRSARGRQNPRSWPLIARRHQAVRDWAKSSRNAAYHELDSSVALCSNLSVVLDKIGMGKVLQEDQAKKNKHTLCRLEYLTVSKLLAQPQLEMVRWYITNTLYMREMGAATGNASRWVSKPRGIRLEGDPECGIAYKRTPVDPVPIHPITRFLLEVVNTYFGMTCNTAQFSLMFPDKYAQRYIFGFISSYTITFNP